MAGLYSRLAATGIRKNGRAYIPYILTAALMISIFYIVAFLANNSMLLGMVGGRTMGIILRFGEIVMGIFSAIFLFYTNSFLIKRRKKEFGLYNILGLGKRQIARVLVRETFFVYLIAEVFGLGIGILFSKMAEMLAMRMLRGNINYIFYVDFAAVIISLILFAVIFAIILVNSLRQLFFSRPVELLHSENTGEKPPRTNIPGAVIGFLLLGVAYYMAVSIKVPEIAMGMFFIAVILVIIATYLLFIAGSVVLCRILQKNKKYYYKTNHFVSVSQMAFRMRRNGAGLASICILSTMVLVTMSSTVSLYRGIPDQIDQDYPHDIIVRMDEDDSLQTDHFIDVIHEVAEGHGYTVKNESAKHYIKNNWNTIAELTMGLDLSYQGEEFNGVAIYLMIRPIDEADDNIKAMNIELGDDEVAIIESGEMRITANPTVKFGELEFAYQAIDDPDPVEQDDDYYYPTDYATIYVRDMETMGRIYKAIYDVLQPINEREEEEAKQHGWNINMPYYVDFITEYGFDISEDINEVNDFYEQLNNSYGVFRSTVHDAYENMHMLNSWYCRIDTRATLYDDSYGMFGGLLFLGVLLGSVFALAAALIMYYKQISEGFEDAARFEILRKVGMTRREIKSAINSQVLKVFFLPLITAGIHMLFAFPMLTKMLSAFSFRNVRLFAEVTIIGYLIFAALYVLFYKITSRGYLAIVGGKPPRLRSDKE